MADFYINPLNNYTPPHFTDEQKRILNKYFTNLDKPVYAFTSNVPSEVAGALISRFSRTNVSPRELFLEEFLKNPDLNLNADEVKEISLEGQNAARERAGKFFRQVLAKYGDESVAEITGVHVVVEKASAVAIKVIESMRRMAFIEQSTRYIDLSEKVNGKYEYYRDAKLVEVLGENYEKHADELYDTYREWFEKVKKHVMDNNPKLEEDTEIGYNQSVHSRTCDILRELLPIGIRATVGIYGFGRDWGDLVNIMLSHHLDEVRELGKMILDEVSKIIPNIMERTSGPHGQSTQEYFQKRDSLIRNKVQTSAINTKEKKFDDESLNIFDAKILYLSDSPLERLCAGAAYPETSDEYNRLLEYYKYNPQKRDDLLNSLNDLRQNRFNKVPDGFETVRVQVEFTAPYSCWKDIQRHRRLTQLQNKYSINKGFYISPEIVQLKLEEKFKNIIDSKLNFIFENKIKHPEIASELEYLIPHAATFRWVMNMDFAEVIYMIEIRSAPAGHMAYRKIMHEFYYSLEKLNPQLAKLIKYVDLEHYYLGRRTSYNKVVQKGASLE